jgi:hypothetical protein
MARHGFTILAFVVFLFGASGQAQIPRTLTYQGLLTDTLGTPLPDGSYSMTFRLYQTSNGGSALWQEVRTLQTKRGLFSTNLGEVTPLGLSFDRQYWLGIQINGNPELSPRMALTASGYSLRSQKADTAAYALTAPQQGVVDSARVAGTIPNNSVGTTKIQDNAVTSAKILDGTIQRADVASNFKAPRADTADYAITGVLGPWNINGSDISFTNGNVGIGTSTPTAKLDVTSSGSAGVRAAGGTYGIDASGGSVGGQFAGTGGGSYGVYAAGIYGVYGTGATYGIGGTSSSGTGVYGSSSSGTAVYGSSTNSYGVYASSTNGYGLYATGGPNGVVASAISGAGVSGTSSGGPGVVAIGGTNGVEATGTTRGVYATGGDYGVVGAANNIGGVGVYGSGTTGGYFNGAVTISGWLNVLGFIYKTGGGFKIDHPLDPSNKYLYHSFVESPDMMNIYNGNITLDANGEAAVGLPDWFGTLNKEFRYQLTAIGVPGPNLYIAEEISQNHFKIAGGTAGMRVSWQVTGIRQDTYAKAHRIPIEEEKPAEERGKYLHPQEEGVSEPLGMNYEMTRKMEAERKRQEEHRAKTVQERSLLERQK